LQYASRYSVLANRIEQLRPALAKFLDAGSNIGSATTWIRSRAIL